MLGKFVALAERPVPLQKFAFCVTKEILIWLSDCSRITRLETAEHFLLARLQNLQGHGINRARKMQTLWAGVTRTKYSAIGLYRCRLQTFHHLITQRVNSK